MEKIRKHNHMGERAFVVTQSIKTLNAQDRQWALDTKGFKSLYDDKVVDPAEISKDDETIYYKNTPYTPKDLPQRLIITYSPKYAKYRKSIREKISAKGGMPKNRQYYRKTKYPDKVTKPKRLVFVRIFLFRSARSKITYFPTVPFCIKKAAAF